MLAADGGGGLGAALGQVAARTAKSVKKNLTSRGSSSRSSGYAHSVNRKPRYSSSSGGGSSFSSGGGSSRGGSSRSSGGGGGGAAPKAPSVPSLNDYLGTDSVYQQSVSGGKRSLNDFLSEMTRRRGEAGTQFTQTQGSMERDRVTQLEDLKNEFASRGLIQSGLYGEEQGKFQQKFTEQQTALQQQQAALLADLLSQEKNYRRENDLATQQAKQEALARRAAKYNIGA